MPSIGRADFNYRVIIWDEGDQKIASEVAGLDDFEMAMACFDIAVRKHPALPVTVQQGARVVRKNRD